MRTRAQDEPERRERSSTQVRRARAAGTRLVTTAPAAKRMTPPARVSWRVNRESSPPVSP